MPDFKLPSLGEDIQEADVLKILVSEGDTVTAEQPIMEIETEKATLDVPAEAAGTVSKMALEKEAERFGAFGEERLGAAIASLAGNGYLVDLGDGWVKVTPAGRLASVSAPRT